MSTRQVRRRCLVILTDIEAQAGDVLFLDGPSTPAGFTLMGSTPTLSLHWRMLTAQDLASGYLSTDAEAEHWVLTRAIVKGCEQENEILAAGKFERVSVE